MSRKPVIFEPGQLVQRLAQRVKLRLESLEPFLEPPVKPLAPLHGRAPAQR